MLKDYVMQETQSTGDSLEVESIDILKEKGGRDWYEERKKEGNVSLYENWVIQETSNTGESLEIESTDRWKTGNTRILNRYEERKTRRKKL